MNIGSRIVVHRIVAEEIEGGILIFVSDKGKYGWSTRKREYLIM